MRRHSHVPNSALRTGSEPPRSGLQVGHPLIRPLKSQLEAARLGGELRGELAQKGIHQMGRNLRRRRDQSADVGRRGGPSFGLPVRRLVSGGILMTTRWGGGMVTAGFRLVKWVGSVFTYSGDFI